MNTQTDTFKIKECDSQSECTIYGFICRKPKTVKEAQSCDADDIDDMCCFDDNQNKQSNQVQIDLYESCSDDEECDEEFPKRRMRCRVPTTETEKRGCDEAKCCYDDSHEVKRPRKEAELFICDLQDDCDMVFMEKNRECRAPLNIEEYRKCLDQKCCYLKPYAKLQAHMYGKESYEPCVRDKACSGHPTDLCRMPRVEDEESCVVANMTCCFPGDTQLN